MSLDLAGYQRRALRAAAHDLQPVAHVGKDGLSETFLRSVDEALAAHELIKVRFVDHKDERKEMAARLAERLDAAVAGVVGHVAILYRPHAEPEKRRVELPRREG
ncbi:MAG TPA: ribosome assembly RNA-binding protein YhbY [Candidatus Krumholzibacteria bacterium]|nr:ribosome assembly RNA-binding protein YhbY [Candidatus Krumholzibacteria bacterium]